MLDLADRALYRAKQGGRNQWVGVLGAPDADPAVALLRKDEDLERLAEALDELRREREDYWELAIAVNLEGRSFYVLIGIPARKEFFAHDSS